MPWRRAAARLSRLWPGSKYPWAVESEPRSQSVRPEQELPSSRLPCSGPRATVYILESVYRESRLFSRERAHQGSWRHHCCRGGLSRRWRDEERDTNGSGSQEWTLGAGTVSPPPNHAPRVAHGPDVRGRGGDRNHSGLRSRREAEWSEWLHRVLAGLTRTAMVPSGRRSVRRHAGVPFHGVWAL